MLSGEGLRYPTPRLAIYPTVTLTHTQARGYRVAQNEEVNHEILGRYRS
jgi:hypothetical protein